MKKRVGLIGKGKWGSKIRSKLSRLASLKFVSGRKKNYLKLIKKNELDWIFIATPNSTHYQIVKKCLNLNLNVFCEKPITENFKKAKELFEIAKKNKVNLYVSDVYAFHKKKINKIFPYNKIKREKNIKGKDNEFFFRFMYHDISILYSHIKDKKLRSIKLNQNKKKKISYININFKDKTNFLFEYNLKSRIKRHTINDINFITKDDALSKMINSLLYKKIDIRLNNLKALFILKFLTFLMDSKKSKFKI
tara:strand:+ start:372 stop:1121 length:750 start_codon:yes stop_codon:yes gene_type:complete